MSKAKTPFYHDKKRLSTIDVVRLCAKFNKKAVLLNIEKINELLDFSKVDDIFNKIPKEFYNHLIELEFSKKILEINKGHF